MHDIEAFQGLALMALMLSSILISRNITHHLFGGSHAGIETWIAIMSVMGTIAITIYLGESAGFGGWSVVPAMIAAMLVGKVCVSLGLYDRWSEKRHPSMLRVKRYVAALTVGAIVTSLLIATLPAPLLYYALALPGVFGMSAVMIAISGWVESRDREEQMRRNSRIDPELLRKMQVRE